MDGMSPHMPMINSHMDGMSPHMPMINSHMDRIFSHGFLYPINILSDV
jgi:hypothetical protein